MGSYTDGGNLCFLLPSRGGRDLEALQVPRVYPRAQGEDRLSAHREADLGLRRHIFSCPGRQKRRSSVGSFVGSRVTGLWSSTLPCFSCSTRLLISCMARALQTSDLIALAIPQGQHELCLLTKVGTWSSLLRLGAECILSVSL